MFKGIGDLASLLKQAHQMQSKIGDLKEQLAQVRVEGQSGGGMVRVEATGQQKILAIHVDPSLLSDNDREIIEDLLVAATNQALDKARQAAADQMGDLAGEMNIPGLGDALANLGGGGSGAGGSAAS